MSVLVCALRRELMLVILAVRHLSLSHEGLSSIMQDLLLALFLRNSLGT